jgi:hypothetical protein
VDTLLTTGEQHMVKNYIKNSKTWKVQWKNPWTGKTRTYSFSKEEEANSFLDAQRIISVKERLLLKKSVVTGFIKRQI